jgi:UDP-2-acetamido-3-amino-2,3-dideoxy-glucuronate N-acetyltransferase
VQLRKTYIHPTAEVHAAAEIGEGVLIWNWSKVRERARVGAATNIGQNVYIDLDTQVGARCKLQNGVSVFNGVTLGDDVFVGPNATFTNDLLPRAHMRFWEVIPTVVEDGASIGASATIVCGIRLGRHCMIGAGTVVTRDVPPYALVVGSPARVIDYVTISGRRMGWKPGEPVPDESILADKRLGFEGREDLQA